MILAVDDHVELWGSPDLKSWRKLSDFGKEYGAHGGVWECPDLFLSKIEGDNKSKWVMLVSLNPGGPNGGSSTQYFVGDFDGTTFKPDADKKTTTWLDYGPDNYAGVTWFNAPEDRKIFLGWMSNWAYAQDVPTSAWRSANTIPRDLILSKIGERLLVKSRVSPEVLTNFSKNKSFGNIEINNQIDFGNKEIDFSKSVISGSIEPKDFVMEFYNEAAQKLTLSFDEKNNQFLINRGAVGKTDFSKNFITDLKAPRLSNQGIINFKIVVDVSSIEVFFDEGLTVMTSLYFPDQPLTGMRIKSTQPLKAFVEVNQLNSIW
jgi:fructan beta-fructosidase